jgi:hypothetical protein
MWCYQRCQYTLLILSNHTNEPSICGLFFLSGFPAKTFYAFVMSCTRFTSTAYLKQKFCYVVLSSLEAKYNRLCKAFTAWKIGQIALQANFTRTIDCVVGLVHLQWQYLIKSPMKQVTCARWFKYDRDKLWLVYTQIVPVIFEPLCMLYTRSHWRSYLRISKSLASTQFIKYRSKWWRKMIHIKFVYLNELFSLM